MYKRQDEELLPFIPDYRINMLAPRAITDFTGFRTSIRQLFEVLQNAYDKEKMQEVDVYKRQASASNGKWRTNCSI